MTALQDARVLLVDDQSLVRIAIRHMLAALGVTEVYEASSGEEAIAVLLEQPLDVVISDIDMAPQNGMEFLRNIRSGNYGMRRDLRLIMLTGLTAPEVAKACVSLDVNAFLTKPAKKDMLKERLEFALTMPMELAPIDHYQQQQLPVLVRAASMVARTGAEPAPANHRPRPVATVSASSATARSTAPRPIAERPVANRPAVTAGSTESVADKPAEPSMAYVIWHERFETGLGPADVIVRDAARRLNDTHRLRGGGCTVQQVDKLVQDWLAFCGQQLAQLEALLQPVLGEEKQLLLARLRREFTSRLSQLRLLLQATPDIASYELFDVARHWWSAAYAIWRRHS